MFLLYNEEKRRDLWKFSDFRISIILTRAITLPFFELICSAKYYYILNLYIFIYTYVSYLTPGSFMTALSKLKQILISKMFVNLAMKSEKSEKWWFEKRQLKIFCYFSYFWSFLVGFYVRRSLLWLNLLFKKPYLLN